jgi:proline iminopeptidase
VPVGVAVDEHPRRERGDGQDQDGDAAGDGEVDRGAPARIGRDPGIEGLGERNWLKSPELRPCSRPLPSPPSSPKGARPGEADYERAKALGAKRMPGLYPPIEPYETGRLDVGHGHSLYWEACGNPAGTPALVLHGGPGSGCGPGMRRMFDPARFRTILFDQRGCGRSTPNASDPTVSLAHNTTAHLLADIERLRRHVGVDRWLVFGGSWGAALGLAYAQRHPAKVAALVLSHASASRPEDFHWLYHGVGRYFPEAWERFRQGAGEDADAEDLIEAYRALLASPDAAVREKAAKDWCDWEAAVISLDPAAPRPPRYDDPAFRMCFARIVTHYFAHNGWFHEHGLLEGMHRLEGVPGAIVQGRRDLGSPLEGPWHMAQAWPEATLEIIENAGHETRTPGVIEATVAAIERLAPA